MTKIEHLIKELCPNGVEYKKLGEIATISRGGSFQKKDFCEDGVPCIHYGQIYTRYGLFADKTLTFISEDAAKKQKYAVKNDIVMAVTSENIDDVCKCVAWLGDDEIAVSGHTAIIHHTLNPKYLCYYFHTAMFYAQKKKLAHGTKVIEVTPDKLTDITIPVPPIEIQVEIVKILDNFTELTAELTARKKQYEYYRDLLLGFGVHRKGTSEFEWRTLESFADVRDGTHDSPKPSDYGYPLVTSKNISGGILDLTSCYLINENDYNSINQRSRVDITDVLVSMIGTIGETIIVTSEPNYAIKNIGLVKTGNLLTSKYIKYYISSSYGQRYIQENIKGTAPRYLSLTALRKFSIPVPPIEEQERIVSILDRFDKLCNDISEGLPAEIEARRKQYEYYRDKLLSFEERKNA